MEEEHVAYGGYGERLVRRGTETLYHAAGEENVVGMGEAGLVEACDADAGADGAEEAGEEELRALSVLFGEYGHDGTEWFWSDDMECEEGEVGGREYIPKCADN